MNDAAVRYPVQAAVVAFISATNAFDIESALAARAVERVPSPVSICIALHVAGAMSRGSAVSASQHVTAQCLMRKGDVLTARAPDALRDIDFGNGPVSCFPVTLPDLITIARQTGVGDIETYVHVSGSAFPEGGIDALPDGPTAQERADNRYQAAVEVVGADGAVTRAVLDTVNGYSFTPNGHPRKPIHVIAPQRNRSDRRYARRGRHAVPLRCRHRPARPRAALVGVRR